MTLVTQATLLAAIFGLYSLWDLLDHALRNAQAIKRLPNSLLWMLLFVIVAVVTKWAWEPRTVAPTLAIDAAFVVALFLYRIRQEAHW